jgi:serine/threonine protein kinase
MAEVLIARATGEEGFERHVVLKRIRAEQAKDPEYVKMFVDEARLAASLHHQNIVQVHDIGEADGEYFFAMEYIHGEDLRRILTVANGEQTQLPLQHIVMIIAQAAAGLHHAHEQLGPDRTPLQIVHRDVSPANILVGYDGSVKVVDFGIAKAALRTQETRSGTLKGKVSYMSPEQCVGAEVDRRSDVFALGIVLYELVTVRRLFKGQNDFLTMAAIVQANIPPPSTHRPDLPTALEAIILKALSPRPENRFASCDEMRRALEAFADQEAMQTSPSAVAAYLKTLLGERPLPWESADDIVELEALDPDFDGAEPGIATSNVLTLPPGLVARDSSPLVRAQGGTSPMLGALRPPAPPRAPSARPPTPLPIVSPDPSYVADETAGTASGTPMTWVSVLPAQKPPRGRALIAGMIAAPIAALALILVIATRGGGDPTESEPITPAASPRVAPPAATLDPPAPAPAPPPPPQEPAVAPPPATVPTAPTAPIEQPKPKKPRPAVKTGSGATRYDPKSLFPTKKPK